MFGVCRQAAIREFTVAPGGSQGSKFGVLE